MGNLPSVLINTNKDFDMCFACGKKNPVGLKLKFEWDGKTARAEFVPTQPYQGWPGLLHGGIVQCLLDEAMSKATRFIGLNCVTAEMHSRLKRPALIGEPLMLAGSIVKQTRRLVKTQATISLKDGTLVAEGNGTHFVVSQQDKKS